MLGLLGGVLGLLHGVLGACFPALGHTVVLVILGSSLVATLVGFGQSVWLWVWPICLASCSKEAISWAIWSSWAMALCSNGFQAISSMLGGQLGSCGRDGGLLVTLVLSDVVSFPLLEVELDSSSSMAAKSGGQWSVDP